VLILKKISVRVDDGCLDIEYTGEFIRVIGSNFSFEFKQRSATLKNVSSVEVYTIRGGRKKVIYAKYRGVPVSCMGRDEISAEEVSTELFTARIVKSGLGVYMTLIFSGYFYLDYAVMSRDLLGIIVSGKREVYAEKTGSDVTIYLV
jgi:hypothetical protein